MSLKIPQKKQRKKSYRLEKHGKKGISCISINDHDPLKTRTGIKSEFYSMQDMATRFLHRHLFYTIPGYHASIRIAPVVSIRIKSSG